MSNLAQMEDSIEAMKDFVPLNEKEMEAIGRVKEAFSKQNLIPCTGCRYCIEENDCPKKIRIPDLFAAANDDEAFHTWNSSYYWLSKF